VEYIFIFDLHTAVLRDLLIPVTDSLCLSERWSSIFDLPPIPPNLPVNWGVMRLPGAPPHTVDGRSG